MIASIDYLMRNLEDRVYGLHLSLRGPGNELLRDLLESDGLSCSCCKKAIPVGPNAFNIVSQLQVRERRIIFHVICRTCVLPIQRGIKEANDSHEQARPNEAQAATAGHSGSP